MNTNLLTAVVVVAAAVLTALGPLDGTDFVALLVGVGLTNPLSKTP